MRTMKIKIGIILLLISQSVWSQMTETYTSGSGSWLVPPGVCVVTVKAWGGGGKGGSNFGAGGGGGGYCLEDISVAPGDMIDWIVGVGGGTGSGGGGGSSSGGGGGNINGGTTSFGSVYAYGGAGGGNGTGSSGSGTALGGAGGVGCNDNGDDGMNSGSGNNAAGGNGGGVDGGAGGTNGGAGSSPGGGGAGSTTGGAGGLGANGKIVFSYYLPIYNFTKDLYYCNLADAVSAASDQDEIQIPSGIYVQPCIVINKSIKYKAIGGAVVIDCIEMNGSAKSMTLESDFTFNTLKLTLGNIYTNGFNLKCGTITGKSAVSYVITD